MSAGLHASRACVLFIPLLLGRVLWQAANVLPNTLPALTRKYNTMSYDDELPTDKDKIRALVGDTGATELVTDAHINAVLAAYDSFNAALAFVANELAATFAQRPGSVTLPNGLSVSWRDRVSTWLALAKAAISGALTGPAIVAPYAGGLTISGKQAIDADTDRVPPAFTRDLHQEPVGTREELTQ